MKKAKRFNEGGFTKEQEEFLGGADRTDPYILARMRQKFPDAPKAESKTEPKFETETKQGENSRIDAATRLKAVREKAPRYISKGIGAKSINPDRLVRKDILNQFPESKSGEVRSIPSEAYEYDDAGYKKGGKVSSASKRADGCAIKGKTRGRMV